MSGSDFIQEQLAKREQAKNKAVANQALQDAKVQKKLADKLRNVTVIQKKPFWWLPAFLSRRVVLAEKVANLEKALFNHQDFTARQAEVLKGLYRWALEHDPKDGSLDSFKEKLGPLDPKSVWEGSNA